MAENVWILGIHMTKFGKHKDKDTLDLGAEAAIGALRDAGNRDAGSDHGDQGGRDRHGARGRRRETRRGRPVDG